MASIARARKASMSTSSGCARAETHGERRRRTAQDDQQFPASHAHVSVGPPT